MQFLLSVIDDGASPATAVEDAAIDAFNTRLENDGEWVFAGGLGDPSPATTIDNRGARPLVTDGPFIEAKEWLAGFWIIEVEDHDSAVVLAKEASKACNRKVELRPFL